MTTSSEVPGRYPAAIDGRPYMIDPAGFKRESLPVLRQQSDTSALPSEQSLNPRGPWRRSQESWHHGSDQVLFDGKSAGTVADPERFAASSNVDIWTRGQFSLLPETVQVRSSVSSAMVCVANHVYVADGTALYWSSNPTTLGATWTSADIQAGEAAQTIQSLATDGYYVWAALGTSGLHRTVKAATTSTANVPAAIAGGNISLVGYALGRLLVAGSATSTTQRNVLFEVLPAITAAALSPAAAPYLMTHPNDQFVFTFIGPGRNCIYVGGNTPGDVLNLNYAVDQGGTGEVYKITLTANGTALSTPSAATYLPDGESIYDVRFYAGGVILATSRGLRLGQADGSGNIDYGPLIATTKPVLALEPQDRYVWFTGSNEGLHRADLGWFNDPLTPAWAADQVITTTGDDDALVKAAGSLTSTPNPVFLYKTSVFSGTNPSGVYRASATVKRASGYVDSGQIRFGTTETKRLRSVEVQHAPLPTGAAVIINLRINNSGSFGSYVTNTTAGTTSTSYVATWEGDIEFEVIEVRVQLSRSTDTLQSPVVTRWTLRALPAPDRNEVFTLPLLLHSTVVDLNDNDTPVDVPAEITALKALEEASDVIQFQVGADTFEGFIEESEYQGDHWSMTGAVHRFVEGTYVVRMITV